MLTEVGNMDWPFAVFIFVLAACLAWAIIREFKDG